MLFAEESPQIPAWAAAVGIVIAGPVFIAISKWADWLLSKRRELHLEAQKDELDAEQRRTTEQERIIALRDNWITAQDKRIQEQDRRITSLTDRVGKAEVAEAKCQGRVTQMEAELRISNIQVRRLQERMNDTPPGVTKPCQIIASVPGGVIMTVSPEAGAMFHWLPDELKGKHISVLMPRDVKPVHRRAMELLLEENRQADPSHAVLTHGITKEGRRFPVFINLSGPWEGSVPGSRYINAEVRRRGDDDGDSGILRPYGPPPPAPKTDRNPAPEKGASDVDDPLSPDGG